MGVDRLEAARNAHNTTGNIDFGWVLTGSKQPAISCKRPQHKTQHRVRMGAIYLGNPYAFYKCRRRAETPFAGRRRDYKLVCGIWNLEAFLDLWPVAALSGLSSGCPVPSRGVPSCLLHSSSCLRELLDREKQGTRIHQRLGSRSNTRVGTRITRTSLIANIKLKAWRSICLFPWRAFVCCSQQD